VAIIFHELDTRLEEALMTASTTPTRRVAVVDEVLPMLGLAYATDDDGHCWAVTKSTAGVGIDSLKPGQRLALTLADHDSFALASGYAPLD
jgi:hypothetical protein